MIDIDMGRSPSNHVVVHDLRASRQHCKLIMGETTVKLHDLKSRNGTKVEGKSIDEMELHYDQIFQVGDSLFIISPKSLRTRVAEILHVPEDELGMNGKNAHKILFDELTRRRPDDLKKGLKSGSFSKYLQDLREEQEREVAARMAASPQRPKLHVRDVMPAANRPPKS
jgi:hypothetical protein